MSRNRKQFIEEEIKPIKYRNCLYKMKLAQYDVEVNCTKKKEGRQLAAQKILKLMHPHIDTWGSMLRLYGSRMAESFLKMENQSEQEKIEPKSAANSSEKDATSHKSAGVEAATTSSNSASANGTASKITNQKAKPNRELLEKLKEEMRKLKKPTNSSSDASTTDQCSMENKSDKEANNAYNLGHGTLLTIQPLLLGNEEFKLSSSNFLMSTSSNSSEQKADLIAGEAGLGNDDGKIMFADSLLSNNYAENGGAGNFNKRKRKAYSDNGKNSRQCSDSENEEDDDDVDDDEEDEDSSDSGEDDSQSD